ncbi:nitrate/TMAO reductase, membrane-bound tetraheme cytochrome c subunit [Desulfosporosinus orientis DSM 765]|uniref:Nitrate/TMAO reductase, membrane-bound tetraheme cytochrome c subunit n=1 Tax=Desulfosporosinus orientis (strain ATCC 19365 / DSM 765 / NCIMB 8382 / VKM B-1628 / Singapore I) TaxID=768706 RepID=G7W583_DESOD|nr:nitrate/TMAO reductase, membrane-bound tetraheme cytochrome c subunit [Desulfosporosinus orientis DSM 765]
MRSYKKGILLYGLIFLGIYICFRFTYAWYMNPSSCKRCHEVARYRISWEESSHKDLDCKFCHENRGPFHRLDSTFRGLRDVAIHIKGDYFSLKAIYYDSNCINCHTGNFKPETNGTILPKNHAKYLKNGVGCNNCHRDTGHKNGLNVDERFEELED